MTQIYVRRATDADFEEVTDLNPFPVELVGSRVTTRGDFFDTGLIRVPGVGAGVAYAASDTFGTYFEIQNLGRVPGGSFVITTVMFYDLDDKGIGKTLHLFDTAPTLAADNAAWALADVDTLRIMPCSPLSVILPTDHVNGQTFKADVTAYGKCLPNSTSIFGALQTSGVETITAGVEPYIRFIGFRD